MTKDQAEKSFRDYLRRHDMFYTKERALILEAVYNTDDHFSADELVFQMQQQGLKVSRATLYRALGHMNDAGILNQADFGHGHTHYEPPRMDEPHEHIACEKCGKISEVIIPDLEKILHKAAQKAGFSSVQHHLRMTGICKKCQ